MSCTSSFFSSISIHALREEGDVHHALLRVVAALFLSTPSARRATKSPRSELPRGDNFYPRPPRGGRLHSGSFSSTR